MKKLYEEASVQDIADAIREKTGGAETYRIAQMGAAVRSIPGGDQIAHADIPDYVKDGVLTLAQKVQAVKTASSIVFVTVADAHHATDETTGWKANIEAGNMDACRAIKALSHVTPLDFAAFLGDLTFGYKTTTAAQFEAQCREFHRWIEEGLRGIPQLWTPGNHDTVEYFAAETGSLTNLYGAALIRKYFSDYNAGAVYGSAEAGYCYRDLPGKKLRIIKKYGATRISINPQTFSDQVLQNIGRRHTAQDIIDCFAAARAAGHKNINMDLIAGLPGDTVEGFRHSLQTAIDLDPENITVHTLTLKRASNLVVEHRAADYADVAAMVESCELLEKAGYRPYYLYRQKGTLQNLENVGWCKPGHEGYYNIYIMEEVQTILSAGAGGSTKLVADGGRRMQRIFNFKYPTEYIQRFDEVLERKKGVADFYDHDLGTETSG